MTKIEIITTSFEGVETEHVIIDHGNEQFTSMPKEIYDKQQAEQSTPNLAD
jgi:hypothetical protein